MNENDMQLLSEEEAKKYVDLVALKHYDELLKQYIAEAFEWKPLGINNDKEG